jgi:hypothetical protein
MAKYEARVKTKLGEIVFNFNTIEDLKSNIEALDVSTVSEILWKKFESLVTTEPRKPKPGFEKLYNFTSSGLVEVAYISDDLTKPELIAFILFAYHPDAASTQQISLSSGIKSVTNYLSQTNYKKFWWKTQNGDYMLGDEGLKWVFSKILPKFKVTGESKEKIQEAQTQGTVKS